MIKFIKKLYKRYFKKTDDLFLYSDVEMTQKDKKALYVESKIMIDVGALKKIMELVVAESENRQLYEASNTPITTTPAELERQKRIGIEELWLQINKFANKANPKEESFDVHSIT